KTRAIESGEGISLNKQNELAKISPSSLTLSFACLDRHDHHPLLHLTSQQDLYRGLVGRL
ncbi:MAG: hypothetical protein NZ936_20080, partial [Alphaproteobacteria bacterium]|nr:hypothetical protein [Alphaproteobacteria bacterium]